MQFRKRVARARACAFALAAMTSALPVAWASGAAAQPFEFFGGGPFAPRVYAPDDDWGAPNPRRLARRALEAQGYELLGPLERGGRVFEARVEDQRGRRFRVIVDARTGQVIERFPLGGGFSAPPRPPRNVGPDRFDRFDRFYPYAGPDYVEPPPPFARGAPAPAVAPRGAQQQKPASRQARKPPAADKQGAQSARVGPAQPQPQPQRQDRPEATPPAAEAPAPAPTPAPARNANLRRPDAPQRAPAAQAPASSEIQQEAAAPASRPAPRVVYPDSAASSATGR